MKRKDFEHFHSEFESTFNLLFIKWTMVYILYLKILFIKILKFLSIDSNVKIYFTSFKYNIIK